MLVKCEEELCVISGVQRKEGNYDEFRDSFLFEQ